MIGVVVAESQLVAMTAAKKVKIEYTDKLLCIFYFLISSCFLFLSLYFLSVMRYDTAGYTPITSISVCIPLFLYPLCSTLHFPSLHCSIPPQIISYLFPFQDAIKAKSFHKPLGGIPEKIEKGDVEKTFTDPSLTVIGTSSSFSFSFHFLNIFLYFLYLFFFLYNFLLLFVLL